MNASTQESFPDETAAPRRRRAHPVIPPAWAEIDPRLGQLDDVSQRSLVGLDFLLFSLLAGILVGAAILTDSPALFLLAILVAPFPSPVIGLSLSALAGSGRFFLQSLGGVLLGAIPIFLGGLAAGYAPHYFAFQTPATLLRLAEFNWPTLIVLSAGSLLSTMAYLRSRGRYILPGVALSYGLYLPLAMAGYGFSSGQVGVCLSMIILSAACLAWSVLLGVTALLTAGQRPFGFGGYLLGLAILAACLVILLGFSGQGNGLIQKLPAWLYLPGGSPTPAGLISPSATASMDPVLGTTQETRAASPTLIQNTPAATVQPSLQGTSTVSQATKSAMQPSPGTPSVTATRTPKPTHTLLPTQTPVTSTPIPTPVWALIQAVGSDGAFIRSEPRAGSQLLTSLLNGSLVEVLPETVQEGTSIWVHIRTDKGLEGWIIQSLLATATPSPQW